MVFEPYTIIAFAIGIVLIFIPEAIKGDVIGNFIRLGSIVLISPLAFFFGKEYKKSGEDIEKIKEKTEVAAETIEREVEDVLQEEKANLKKKDVEKLEEVIEETKKLRKEE